MRRALVLGAHTEGIGDAVVSTIIGYNRVAIAPTVAELDLRDEEAINQYMQDHGPFDDIVYSAGVSQLQWIKDITTEDLGKVFGVNAFGLALVAAAHNWSYPDAKVRCVAVISDAAHTPMRGSLAYCASKAAQEMIVRCMARELSPTWITVGVSPGVVEGTPMTQKIDESVPGFRGWSPKQAKNYADSGLVFGRRVTKQEVADLVLFALEGPETLNGSIITINGGK